MTPPPAHTVRGDAEAIVIVIAIATERSRKFAQGAAQRDVERILPRAEFDDRSASGLLGITVPRAQ